MEQTARAIVKRYLGTDPQKMTSLGGGWFGRVFLAEMAGEPFRLVVKIHLLPGLAEQEACQLRALAAHATVKMPSVFYVHRATPDIPNDAIIMEFIPGVSVGSLSHSETAKNRDAIAHQIVDNLLSYHRTVNPDGFGEIGAAAFEPNWNAWYKTKADESLSKAESLYGLGKIDDVVLSVMRKAHELYDGIFYLPVVEARLTHGDYTTKNILMDEQFTHISGVIDPLGGCWADSELDLYQLNEGNGKDYDLLHIYASKCPLSENFAIKSSFYELFLHVARCYDAGVEIDYPFMAAMAKELDHQMQGFGLL